MKPIHSEYIVDKDNKRKAILLPMNEWKMILDKIESWETSKPMT